MRKFLKKFSRKEDSSSAENEQPIKDSPENRRYKKTNGNNRSAFGDSFLNEKFGTAVNPEPPSKYTSFSPSTEFRLEAEKIHNLKMEKAVVRKIDIRVIPLAATFFLFSFLDRMNIGNLKVAGLAKDLELSDYDFSLSLTMTFIGYIVIEFPSNIALAKIGAGKFLPSLVVIWGIITISHAFLTDRTGLYAARFFLGIAEGGLYPGLILYLSSFYTRTDLQLRIALFYSTTCLAGMCSGFLTYAITFLDGALGLAGWSWVFIVEGIITLLTGLFGFFVMASVPADAKFLTKEEKSIILLRLARDRCPILGGEPSTEKRESISSIKHQLLQSIKSPHVILFCVSFFLAGSNMNSLAYFGPSIVESFGLTRTDTQLLTVPPYAVGLVIILVVSYLSDKYSARSIAIIFAATLSATGFSIFYFSQDILTRYGSLFFSISGVYTVMPCLGAWLENNSEPYTRKAINLALGPMCGNFGGLVTIWVFVLAEKPLYLKPTMINISFSILLIVISILNLSWLMYADRIKIDKREEILRKFYASNNELNITSERKLYEESWESLGDKHPDFKYTY
ncbi:major facilitator superfamily domain-containing protein [Phakopsora pachyrhizi]|uniref:Major facilitator superfamily domain-containing protein n=1 Tax=Phakopsora pachyrhizi TaxID=170000 RepID=A0AAV0BHD4_PHAPC|nr:major facilitator superfamily domain-containing protein [Phakopsora pachyrhizi]